MNQSDKSSVYEFNSNIYILYLIYFFVLEYDGYEEEEEEDDIFEGNTVGCVVMLRGKCSRSNINRWNDV